MEKIKETQSRSINKMDGSFGQKNKLRPVFIVLGFVIVFTIAAVVLSLLAKYLGFDANIIRNLGIFILAVFGKKGKNAGLN